MSGVSSVMAQQVALTRAQVQTEIAVFLMKVAKETGPEKRMLELVRDVATSASQNAAAAASGPVDLYA